jgi:hypothetical protein
MSRQTREAYQKGAEDADALIKAVREELDEFAYGKDGPFARSASPALVARYIVIRLLRDGWRRA